MKSERRHELQHNDLAEWFITTYERALPYRSAIIGTMLLLIVAGVAWSIWRGHSQTEAAEAWDMIGPPVMSPDINHLLQASNEYKGAPAGEFAQELAADMILAAAENELFQQKGVATQHLAQAMDLYEKTWQSSSNPIGRQRALFAKARILETEGKLSDATAAYEELNKQFPKGAYKTIADSRLLQLSRPETDEFYKALAAYNPKAKKENEKPVQKSAAGPRGKLENMTLPDNPDEQGAPKPPVKSPASSSGTAAIVPKASAPSTSAAPVAPVSPKTEAPKPSAAMPLSTGAPATSGLAPVKTGK
jgi:hypothetical protein